MPKLKTKTHSGAKKRFKVTKNGHVKRAHAFTSHILTKKSTKRKRGLRMGAYADVTNEATVRKHDPLQIRILLHPDNRRQLKWQELNGAMMTRKRRNRTLKLAKGYWGSKSKHFKMAKQALMKSGAYAYAGRRMKKRDFRQLWITRISAACKANGMNYSTFMHGLKLAEVQIDRKMLAELAVNDKAAFTQLVELSKSKLA